MRLTNLLAPTLREAPKDAELVSHRLLVRAGYIRPLASGVYTYLTLGLRVLGKISNILREEMARVGGNEVLMPTLVPRELLVESGRDKVDVLYSVRQHDQFLGFTHEEVITDIVRSDIQSYKQLPLLPYQIQTKFRNEPRPRGGLIRGREFLMLDAYSFDRDEAGAERAYYAVRGAFARMFARCGLDFLSVEADSGAIGGSQSEEFMVLSDDGEDTVLRCDATGYAANAERCEAVPSPAEDQALVPPPMEEVSTPGKGGIEDVAEFLGIPTNRMIKSLVVMQPSGEPMLVLVRGDREMNEAKLAQKMGGPCPLADQATVEAVTGAPLGFAGPINLKRAVRIIADREVQYVRDGCTGVNKADTHIVHVLPGRDFPHPEYLDLRTAIAGDISPIDPNGHLYTQRGIEVGHVFNLGTRYSGPMHAAYSDEAGQQRTIVMGCYGLGVSRTMAAAVEQCHDNDGIVWPIAIAPFQVAIILLSPDDDAQRTAAEAMYAELTGSGVDVLLDDRVERPGVKFKDGDLFGVPIKVTVGRGLAEGVVEISLRRDAKNKESVPVGDAIPRVRALITRLQSEIAAKVPE